MCLCTQVQFQPVISPNTQQRKRMHDVRNQRRSKSNYLVDSIMRLEAQLSIDAHKTPSAPRNGNYGQLKPSIHQKYVNFLCFLGRSIQILNFHHQCRIAENLLTRVFQLPS